MSDSDPDFNFDGDTKPRETKTPNKKDKTPKIPGKISKFFSEIFSNKKYLSLFIVVLILVGVVASLPFLLPLLYYSC